MAAASSPQPLFDADTLTVDSLDAFLSLHPSISRIDAFPSTKVLLSSQPPASPSHTLLISGGGDGHQPAHAGYIGQGMLTAAVSGDVFASPPSAAILSCIRCLPAASPLLLIVKNYTGDRLNFGLALQQAREGRDAEVGMVVVGDDAAMERGRSAAGRRGLAGTVLVHKLAGAAAAEGRSLKEVLAAAEDVSARLCSLGVAFSGCRLPGREEETGGLQAGEMELGLGIHGEPGVARQPVRGVAAVVQQMLDLLLSTSPSRDYFHREAADSASSSPVCVVLLVNNLSAMLQPEMSIVAAEAEQQLRVRGLQVERAVTGTLMTAMAMRGFSLTLLRLPADSERKAQMLRWLDAPTTAPAWPTVPPFPPQRAPLLPLPPAPPLPSASASSSSSSASSRQARAVLSSACRALVAAAAELDALDRSAGDGDCGSTLRGCAAAILADLDSADHCPPLSPTAALLSSLRRYTSAMGGTTGAVYSLILSPPAAASASSSSLPQLLLEGVVCMQRYSGAREGDRTLVDALLPALRAYIDCERRGVGVVEAMERALAAGREGLEATKTMRARAGRASYVRDAAVVDEDPGAKAVVIALQAALDCLREPH